jgi:hypothetical protein
MQRLGLCVLTVWLCLSSTARADVVPGGILGAETKSDSFAVMCNSGQRGDICTDAIRLNPAELIKSVDPADSDPIFGHPGTFYGGVFANRGQESGNSSTYSADLTTLNSGPLLKDPGDQRNINDLPSATVVPEPGDVFVILLCLAVFAAARLRPPRSISQR